MDDSRCISQEPSEQGFKVYKRRWFILAAVCVVNCSNAMLWLTFAPVADLTAERFHTSLDMVNWLSIVYFVVSVPVGLLAIWILDTIGLRCAVSRMERSMSWFNPIMIFGMISQDFPQNWCFTRKSELANELPPKSDDSHSTADSIQPEAVSEGP